VASADRSHGPRYGVILAVMRIAALSICCAAVALSCVGCDSGHPISAPTTTIVMLTAQQRADAACRAASEHGTFPKPLSTPGRFVNAKPTTVGEARRLDEGGIVVTHPLASAFRGAPSSAFAAYCWTRNPYMYVSFAVGPTGQIAEIATTGWQQGLQPISTPPPGPPRPGSEL